MDTVVDFYKEPDYCSLSCADGGIDAQTLSDEHDIWVKMLQDFKVPDWHYGELVIRESRLTCKHRPMDLELSNGGMVDYVQFQHIVKAFDDPEQAAEVLTGMTVDEYADLAAEDKDHPMVRTFFCALNGRVD